MQANPPKASISNWLGGKRSAVALTFDDWLPGQYEIALPILESVSLPASYYVTLSNLHMRPHYDHWGMLQKVIDSGSEVGNHTVMHKDLSAASRQERMYEIYHAKLVLDSHLHGAVVDTIAYPFGLYNSDVIDDVKHGHIAARAFRANCGLSEVGIDRYIEDFTYDFAKTEEDYYCLNELSFNHGISVEEVVEVLNRVSAIGGFLPLVFHGVYSDKNPHDKEFYDAVELSHFENMVDALQMYREDTWFTTFSRAIKYHRAAKQLSLEHCFSDDYGCGTSRHEYHLKRNSDPFGFNLDFPKMTVLMKLEKDEVCEMVLQSEKQISFVQDGNTVKVDVDPTESIIAIRVKSPVSQDGKVLEHEEA